MRRDLSAVLILAVSVGVSVPLALLLQQPPPGATLPPAGAPDAARIEAIEARLERLERIRAEPASTSESRRTPVHPEAPPERGALQALEQRLLALERRAPPAVGPAEQRGPRPEDATVADAQRTLADPSATIDAKVQAHGRLRRIRDAYTPQMVMDLIRIGVSDPRPQVRAEVWTFFDGESRLPQLVPHLLKALTNDPDGSVRSEAAETLGNYLDDPAALPALRLAAQNDSDPRVRTKAQRTVGGEGAPLDLLRRR